MQLILSGSDSHWAAIRHFILQSDNLGLIIGKGNEFWPILGHSQLSLSIAHSSWDACYLHRMITVNNINLPFEVKRIWNLKYLEKKHKKKIKMNPKHKIVHDSYLNQSLRKYSSNLHISMSQWILIPKRTLSVQPLDPHAFNLTSYTSYFGLFRLPALNNSSFDNNTTLPLELFHNIKL